jgi:hypothetical protein
MQEKNNLPATQGPWIGKEVVAHIEIMYPQAITAAPGTFKTSVRNTVYNQIMAAIEVNDAGGIAVRLKERKRARTKLTAAYRKLRTVNVGDTAADDGSGL